jgi:uncharacterized HAD superfamily protein
MSKVARTITRVGIDLDGTVADYMAGAVPLLAEHYGLTPDFTVDAYHIEEVFGLTKENTPANIRQVLYEELHLFKHLPTLEDDIHLLTHQLKSAGVKVYFVTARDGSQVVREDTLHWLDSNDFKYDDVFHTANKAEFCKHARIHVMHEDEIGQIVNLEREGIDIVMRDQPWNQALPDDRNHLSRKKGRITRVDNWRDSFNAIKEYLG